MLRADKPISPIEFWFYRHYRAVHGVRIAIAFVLCFLFVRLTDIPEGTWPLITLVVVMGPISTWGNVLPRVVQRISGTFAGLISGLIALKLELLSLPLMLVWCFIVMIVCGYLTLGKHPYMALLIGITLGVVVGAPAGDFTVALWRGGDVILGSLMATVQRHLGAARLYSLAHSAVGRLYQHGEDSSRWLFCQSGGEAAPQSALPEAAHQRDQNARAAGAGEQRDAHP